MLRSIFRVSSVFLISCMSLFIHIVISADNKDKDSGALVLSNSEGKQTRAIMDVSFVSDSREDTGSELFRVPIRAVNMRQLVSDLFGLQSDSKIKIKGLSEVNSKNFDHSFSDKADFTINDARDDDEWDTKFFVKPSFDETEKYNPAGTDENHWFKLSDMKSKQKSTAVSLYQDSGSNILKQDIMDYISKNINGHIVDTIGTLFDGDDVGTKDDESDESAFKVEVKQFDEPVGLFEKLKFSRRNIYCTQPEKIVAAFKLTELKSSYSHETKVVIVALGLFKPGIPKESKCEIAHYRDPQNPNEKNVVHIRDYYSTAKKIEYATVYQENEKEEDNGALVQSDRKDEL